MKIILGKGLQDNINYIIINNKKNMNRQRHLSKCGKRLMTEKDGV